jgi:hypothetical protein
MIPSASSPRKQLLAYLLAFGLCVLAVFLKYSAYLSLPFEGDDMAFLREPLIRNVMSGVPKRGWLDFLEVWSPNHGWFYRPTYLTYWMLMHELGLARAGLMHANGLVLHAFNLFLWGTLAFRLSRSALLGGVAGLAAFCWSGGEEAFRWIAAHSTLFAVCGALGAAHCWVSWREKRGSGWYFAGLLCFWLGCSAKNDAAVGIVLFPLLDRFFETGSKGQKLRAYAPYLVAWLLYLVFEWHGARLYGAHSDKVYKIISEIPLRNRPHYVFSWAGSFTGNVIPFYPFSLFTLLCAPLLLTFWRVFKAAREAAGARATRTFGLALGLAGAMSLTPFVSTFQATQSRLLYFPAFPFSLAVAMIGAASVWAALQTGLQTRTVRESDLSAAGIALALCAASVLVQLNWKSSDPALDSMIWFGMLGAISICWRAGGLDARVGASITLAILCHQLEVYVAMEALYSWILIVCGISVLFWRRQWASGMALTYAAWLNPILMLFLLVIRYGYQSFQPLSRRTDTPSLAKADY